MGSRGSGYTYFNQFDNKLAGSFTIIYGTKVSTEDKGFMVIPVDGTMTKPLVMSDISYRISISYIGTYPSGGISDVAGDKLFEFVFNNTAQVLDIYFTGFKKGVLDSSRAKQLSVPYGWDFRVKAYSVSVGDTGLFKDQRSFIKFTSGKFTQNNDTKSIRFELNPYLNYQ